MKRTTLILCVGLIIGLTAAETLAGMPAFARKYRMSCNVCHNPFPRLKAYGEEFAGNGFVLADKDAPRYYADTGDDTLSLIRDLPIALRLEGHILYNNAASERLDFASPYIVKLLSGGAIAKNISYYLYFFLGERGEVAGLEDAFIMFNDLFKTGVSVTLGQFQVSDPLFKRELRLTFEDYEIYRTRTGASIIDLTYDRGLMFNFGFKTGTDFTVEVLNGSGIGEADIFRNFDNDTYKNLFARVSQGIGDHLSVGACAYHGKEAAAEGEGVNRVWIWGVDASLNFDKFELRAQYMERSDDNPFFVAPPAEELMTRGGFAELIFLPQGDASRWYGVLLFNWVDHPEEGFDYTSTSAHVGLLLRRNIRLVAEFNYLGRSPYGEHARVGVGVITAF